MTDREYLYRSMYSSRFDAPNVSFLAVLLGWEFQVAGVLAQLL